MQELNGLRCEKKKIVIILYTFVYETKRFVTVDQNEIWSVK